MVRPVQYWPRVSLSLSRSRFNRPLWVNDLVRFGAQNERGDELASMGPRLMSRGKGSVLTVSWPDAERLYCGDGWPLLRIPCDSTTFLDRHHCIPADRAGHDGVCWHRLVLGSQIRGMGKCSGGPIGVLHGGLGAVVRPCMVSPTAMALSPVRPGLCLGLVVELAGLAMQTLRLVRRRRLTRQPGRG